MRLMNFMSKKVSIKILTVIFLLFVFFLSNQVVNKTYAASDSSTTNKVTIIDEQMKLAILGTEYNSGVKKDSTGKITEVIKGINQFSDAYYSMLEKRDNVSAEQLSRGMSALYDKVLPIQTKIQILKSQPETGETGVMIKKLVLEITNAQLELRKEQDRLKLGGYFNTNTATLEASAEVSKKELGDSILKNQQDKEKLAAERIYCWSGLSVNFGGCIAIGSYFLLYISSWVLWVAALLFDFTISFSLSMHDLIIRFPSIQYSWEVFRNFVNLFFILIVVYIGIATILRLENYGYKKLLGKLIMAAFLINFSMFFTKIIIDFSNMAAIIFYKQILVDAKESSNTKGIKNGDVAGSTLLKSAGDGEQQYISFAIMNSLGLQSVWGVASANMGGDGGLGTGNEKDGNNPAIQSANKIAQQAGATTAVLNPWTMILVGLGGSVFVLFLSFIFIAAAGMFILRTVTLIALMILSPLAFAARILPNTKEHSSKWWKKLNSNAIFAPVYMMMMYVTLKMVWSGGIESKSGLLSLFSNSEGESAINTVIFFVMICFMLIACLTVASSFGVSGAKSFESWGKQGRDWGKKKLKGVGGAAVGAATVIPAKIKGVAFDKLSRSQTLTNLATGDRAIGRFIGSRALQSADNAAKSYRESTEKKKKEIEVRAGLVERNYKQLGGETDMAYYNRTGLRVGTLLEKKGETPTEYEKRTKLSHEGYSNEVGKNFTDRAMAAAYGVELDSSGKPKLKDSGYITKAAELAARGYIDKLKGKEKENTAADQIKKNRERLFKEAETKTRPDGTTKIRPAEGLLFTAANSLKHSFLKNTVSRIVASTNSDNVDENAEKMKRAFEIQHDKLISAREKLRKEVSELDTKASDASLTKDERDLHHAEYTRKSGKLTIMQTDIDEINRIKSEITSILTKNQDLKVAQEQQNTMSGIKANSNK